MKDKVEEAPPEETVKGSPGLIHSFDTIIVNVAGTHGTRYLKVSVGIEYTEKALLNEITARDLQLKDLLNTILSGKRMEEVVSLDERQRMKIEIRDKFNEILTGGQVDNVFFSEFVVQ